MSTSEASEQQRRMLRNIQDGRAPDKHDQRVAQEILEQLHDSRSVQDNPDLADTLKRASKGVAPDELDRRTARHWLGVHERNAREQVQTQGPPPEASPQRRQSSRRGANRTLSAFAVIAGAAAGVFVAVIGSWIAVRAVRDYRYRVG
jgi:hypothetical protein